MGVVRGAPFDRPRYRLARPSEWRSWLTRLHRIAPLERPTFASLESPGPYELGEVEIVDGCFRIKICPRMDTYGVMETLIHEWAHCVREEAEPGSFDAHDDAYWVVLGGLYRAFHRCT